MTKFRYEAQQLMLRTIRHLMALMRVVTPTVTDNAERSVAVPVLDFSSSTGATSNPGIGQHSSRKRDTHTNGGLLAGEGGAVCLNSSLFSCFC